MVDVVYKECLIWMFKNQRRVMDVMKDDGQTIGVTEDP